MRARALASLLPGGPQTNDPQIDVKARARPILHELGDGGRVQMRVPHSVWSCAQAEHPRRGRRLPK